MAAASYSSQPCLMCVALSLLSFIAGAIRSNTGKETFLRKTSEVTLQMPSVLHSLCDSDFLGRLPYSACLRAFGGGNVAISGWNGGRLGNELFQVMHAIVYAEATGGREVILPSVSEHLAALFDLPLRLPIAENLDLQARVRCSLQYSGLFFKDDPPICSGVRRQDYRRALKLYVEPRMNNATKAMCAAEGPGFSGLTIHLRSGDLLHESHKLGQFMPCSYHDAVIAAGQFQNIRVVTESDLSHPCLVPIQDRHRDKNISVQSRSIQEDACAIMTGQNLELGDSTFSQVLEMMNENVKTVFMPKVLGGGAPGWFEVGREKDPTGSLAACPSDGGGVVAGTRSTIANHPRKYMFYHADRREELRSPNDKKQYLLSTPATALVASQACDEV